MIKIKGKQKNFNVSKKHKLMNTKVAMCHEKQRVFRYEGRGTQKAVPLTRCPNPDRSTSMCGSVNRRDEINHITSTSLHCIDIIRSRERWRKRKEEGSYCSVQCGGFVIVRT